MIFGFSCRSFTYCRVRARASAGATEHALEGHNVLCSRQPLAQGAMRSGSKTREVRPSRCETDTSCTSIAKRCASVQTGLAAPRSVSQRDSLAVCSQAT
jgi:hypothetical protein